LILWGLLWGFVAGKIDLYFCLGKSIIITMDKFKQRIQDLETKVRDLEASLKDLQGVPVVVASQPTHYQTANSEQGEIVLDEFDTFRFMRLGKVKLSISNYSDPQGQNSMGVKEKDIYILQNISKEILEYVKGLKNNLFWPTDSMRLHYTSFLGFHIDEENPDISKTEIYVINIGFPDLFTKNSRYFFPDSRDLLKDCCCSGTYFPMSKELKNILDEKVWDFSDFRCLGTNHIGVDHYVNEFETHFSQEISVDFKNNYKIMPQVSFYVTPVRESKITATIKSLTKKGIVFEMKYGFDEDDIPTSGCLHWSANGIVVADTVSLLD